MIDFTRAFNSAWERMVIILFRPFDFVKWLIIGFSAFLAGLIQGGNGFNGGSFNNFNNLDNTSGNKNFSSDFNHNLSDSITKLNSSLHNLATGVAVGGIIIFTVVILIVVFAFVLLMYWLGARGQFMFIDNIVRNRGEVGAPWQRYGRQANSVFGLYLLFLVVSFAIFIPILVIAVVMCIPLFQQNRWPVGGEIAGFVVLTIIYLGLALVLGIIFFIFREFGIPLMFRRGILARPAFVEAVKIIRDHPASVAVFILLRIALAIAVAVLSVMTCCLCCIGVIPYVGTVVLLPALIYVRCFTFDCLAQFGPDYDVWTVDVPPSGPVVPSFSPRPPLG